MPSNSALVAQALKIAKQNGIAVHTKGLTNVELLSLISDLKNGIYKSDNRAAEKQVDPKIVDTSSTDHMQVSQSHEAATQMESQGKDAGIEETQPEPPTLTNKAIQQTNAYVVAKGKAITCKRGVVAEGDEVLPHFFGDGQNTIDDLCKRGYLTKL